MDLATRLAQTKQQFPHIYETIEMLWGYPELQQYLNKLIVNDRDQTRLGFPPEVAKELFTIHACLHAMPDIWSLNYC